MADIAFLAAIVAFFVVCVGYVGLCGRIIGSADFDVIEADPEDAATEDEVMEGVA
jgi:hypothetical protein